MAPPLLLGRSNLHIILRYPIISKLRPSDRGGWSPSSLWLCLSILFLKICGMQVWHHVAQLWKTMTHVLQFLPPSDHEDILQLTLWLYVEYQGFEIWHYYG